MAFDITAAPAAITGLVGTAGVQSATLRWPQNEYPVEIRRFASFQSPPGTVLTTTDGNTFADSNLSPNVLYNYWIRPVRTLSTGEVHYGPYTTVQVTTLHGTIATAAVNTVHVATDAITARTIYTETGDEWVQYGKDPNGNVSTLADKVWTLPDITFTGDGNTQVISCYCRGHEAPKWFRVPSSSVWAEVTASIVDLSNNTVVDSETLIVSGCRVEQQGIGSAYLSFPLEIHFQHTFVMTTIASRNYAVRFKLEAHVDDGDNFILWATDLRQVFWQVFKR
jgi:hypothetical protein